MRVEPVPGMEDKTKPFAEEEMRQHARSSHAVYDPMCELCSQTRSSARHPKQVENEAMIFDYATVKNVEGTSVNTFARRAPRKGAKIDDLERLWR